MEKIKRIIRLLLKKTLRGLLRISIFIPTKKNKILFFAGMRGYICSPKCICEYLNCHYPGQYELWWIGKNKKEVESYPYVKFVKFSPLSLYYALASCQVFVTNGENAICPKSKKRLILCTWHGTAYKRVGFDTNDKAAIIDMKHSAIDVFLSVSKEYTDHLIHSGFRYDGKILNSGYPRNDVFFDKEKCNSIADKVRNAYNVHGIFILFAPTYRGVYQSAEKIDFRIDFSKLEDSIRKRYGDDYTIGVRMHYFDKNEYAFPNSVIDVSSWPDMQDVLCATDILITDYSSSIWDFCFTERPCLLYVPDLDLYKTSRGIYTDPETWPGILCRDMNQLCRSIIELDELECTKKRNNYLNEMGSYEKGVATEMACDVIVQFCEQNLI